MHSYTPLYPNPTLANFWDADPGSGDPLATSEIALEPSLSLCDTSMEFILQHVFKIFYDRHTYTQK